MERQCNLELRLSLTSSGNDDNGGGDHKPLSPSRPSSNQPQRIAIFHNGQISVCDVSELQAPTVIWWAGQCQSGRENEDIRLQFLVQYVMQGVSMKKSLPILPYFRPTMRN